MQRFLSSIPIHLILHFFRRQVKRDTDEFHRLHRFSFSVPSRLECPASAEGLCQFIVTATTRGNSDRRRLHFSIFTNGRKDANDSLKGIHTFGRIRIRKRDRRLSHLLGLAAAFFLDHDGI